MSDMQQLLTQTEHGRQREQRETTLWLDETTDPIAYRTKVLEVMKQRKISKAALARRCDCSASNIYFYFTVTTTQRIPKYIWRTIREMVFRDYSHLSDETREGAA